jgi:uncharacterized protein (TIGR03086 family)
MESDLFELYGRASSWAAGKVRNATSKLDAPTPCEEWDVRTLLNHMLDSQRFFAGRARGEDAAFPAKEPPDLIGDDPEAAFAQSRASMQEAFSQPDALERTGPLLGIAFSDQLLHGWDLARATGQDATMPEGLADVAYTHIHGRFTDEQRKGVFGPEIQVPPDASPQTRLLAYTGRDPGT